MFILYVTHIFVPQNQTNVSSKITISRVLVLYVESDFVPSHKIILIVRTPKQWCQHDPVNEGDRLHSTDLKKTRKATYHHLEWESSFWELKQGDQMLKFPFLWLVTLYVCHHTQWVVNKISNIVTMLWTTLIRCTVESLKHRVFYICFCFWFLLLLPSFLFECQDV